MFVGNAGKIKRKRKRKWKWLIAPEAELSPGERRRYWERIHREANYENVFSLTEDPVFRRNIRDQLNRLGCVRRVLIPGSGSRTFLQAELAQQSSIEEICCTDFEDVLKIAERDFADPKVRYLLRDSANLGFRNEYDAAVVVNSVLSESDAENRAILASIHKALKPGGALVGYFPTILCAVDVDSIAPSLGVSKAIDLPRSTFLESGQGGARQIFYTPLRLRQILKEAGFILENMEIRFFDSEFLAMQGRERYDLNDEDLVVYELLVTAKKEK